MKNFKMLFAYLTLILVFVGQAVAGPEKQKVIEALSKLTIPADKIDAIEDAPLKDFYQVLYGGRMFYVSHDLKHVMFGTLLDLSQEMKHINVTEARLKIERKRVISKVDEHDMIVFKPDKTEAVITVFTDLDCHACRELHKNIAELNKQGVAIRYMAFPRAGYDSPGFHKAEAVWCSSDPKTMFALAKNGGTVPEHACKSDKIKSQFALGLKLGITATPTLLFGDGSLQPGFLPAEQLAKLAKELK